MSTTAANVEASAEAATDFQFAGDVGPVTAFNVEPTGMSVTVGMVALGASFTGATARVTTDASDDKSPSDTLTVKVTFPFSVTNEVVDKLVKQANDDKRVNLNLYL